MRLAVGFSGQNHDLILAGSFAAGRRSVEGELNGGDVGRALAGLEGVFGAVGADLEADTGSLGNHRLLRGQETVSDFVRDED